MTTAERPSDHLDDFYYEDYETAGGHRIRYRLAPDGEWCEHVAPGFWAYVPPDKVPPETRVRGELSMANKALTLSEPKP